MSLKQMLQRRNCSSKQINTINLLIYATLLGTILLRQRIQLGVEAKQASLIPLTAQTVYQILNKNNHSNAIPKGRVVTQGIAAVTGFTLGLKKAIGATLLYDIITANITEDINPNATPQQVYLTQEICFSSRNARNLYEAEAIAEAYNRFEEHNNVLKPAVRTSIEKRIPKPKRNRKKNLTHKGKNSRPQRIKAFRPNPQTVTRTSSNMNPNISDLKKTTNANIKIIQPTATTTPELEEADLNNGSNMETTSTTTTSTDNDKSVTCIVLQKPKFK